MINRNRIVYNSRYIKIIKINIKYAEGYQLELPILLYIYIPLPFEGKI